MPSAKKTTAPSWWPRMLTLRLHVTVCAHGLLKGRHCHPERYRLGRRTMAVCKFRQGPPLALEKKLSKKQNKDITRDNSEGDAKDNAKDNGYIPQNLDRKLP